MLRLPQFKNAQGAPAHSKPDGSDWSLDMWCNAILGELGEAANMIKKLRRGDYALDDRPPAFEGATVREALGKELADVVCYTDLLAFQLGISLGDAVAEKFNAISARVGATVEITPPYRVAYEALGLFYQPISVRLDGNEIHVPLGEPTHEL